MGSKRVDAIGRSGTGLIGCHSRDRMDAIVTEEENMDDVDSENEEDNMPIDDELLDVAEEFALADEYHHQFESDVGEEYVWGQQWENDVLDVELQSSPSKRICQ